MPIRVRYNRETIYVGLRPTDNIDVNQTKLLNSWNLYCQSVDNSVDLCCLQNGYSFSSSLASTNITAADYTAAFVSFTGLALDFAAALGVGGSTILTVNQLNAALTPNGFPPLVGLAGTLTPSAAQVESALPSVNCDATYQTMVPTITTLTIEAHGVPLYRDIPNAFFNQYVPYTYGGTHINTPYDIGALMITFNLYPGSYQPSGHVNISRA
jgi:hypothetical protein